MFATGKGRSGFGFFLLSFFLSPLVGFIIALIVKENREVSETNKLLNGDLKKCPKCAELIKSEAIVCRFCGNEDFPIEKKVEIEYSGIFCNKCNEPLRKGYSICDKCGHITLSNEKKEDESIEKSIDKFKNLKVGIIIVIIFLISAIVLSSVKEKRDLRNPVAIEQTIK
jgi:RNA polymerase subunit RPABC4/transcription elongation factor Spt4